jgi:hypothetical protein
MTGLWNNDYSAGSEACDLLRYAPQQQSSEPPAASPADHDGIDVLTSNCLNDRIRGIAPGGLHLYVRCANLLRSVFGPREDPV